MGLAAAEDHANAAHACFDGQPVSAEPVHVLASFSMAGAVSFGAGVRHKAFLAALTCPSEREALEAWGKVLHDEHPVLADKLLKEEASRQPAGLRGRAMKPGSLAGPSAGTD